MLKLHTTLGKIKIFIFLIVFIYLLVLNGQSFWYNIDLKAQEEEVREQLFAAQKRHQALMNKKLTFRTKAVLEIAARERLGLVKEGEVAFRILAKEK